MHASKVRLLSSTKNQSGAAKIEEAAQKRAPARSPRPRDRSVSAATPPAREEAPPAKTLIKELYTAKRSCSAGNCSFTVAGNHTRMAKPAQKRRAEAKSNHRAGVGAVASEVLTATSPSVLGAAATASCAALRKLGKPNSLTPPSLCATASQSSAPSCFRNDRGSEMVKANKETATLTKPKTAQVLRQPTCVLSAAPKEARPPPM
mmetsp:Transcript_58408/g.125504  ORF Transcript_58408/g.125504 Transcript_58408/m.125504 type:complete len:205 (+) Transcript_58408:392-1006(+)